MSPETTVLLSVFNQAEYLDRCLASVLAQTYQDFEIICVDDASTDRTPTILRAWQNKCAQADIPLTIISLTTNEGLTRALNRGIAKATGTYIARLDGDDWWHREKLAKQLAVFHRDPALVVVGCWYVNVYPNRQQAVRPPYTSDQIVRSITRRNPFGHSCVVMPTQLVKKLGGYNTAIRYGQDWDLWLRLYPWGKMINLPEYLCWRESDRGISRSKQREQMKQAIITSLKYCKLYQQPLYQYAYLITPLLIIYSPTWLKKLYGYFSAH